MKQRPWCLTLALVIGLEAFVPPAFAQSGEPPRDALADAFQNLQRFARTNAQPTSADPNVAAVPVAGELDADADGLNLKTSVELGKTDYLTDVERAAVLSEVSEVLHAIDSARARFVVHVDWSFLPEVRARTYGHDGRVHLHLPVGLFAFLENRDELAAVMAQAIARGRPEVFGHRDDPRVMRRLSEQVAFESLPEEHRGAIRADLSAIERLRAADRRPWALTDFERRTFSFFREDFARKPSYWLARKVHGFGPKEQLYYDDSIFEVRLLAQKIAVTYLQERENVRDLIKRSHPFTPELRAFHRRARRHFQSYMAPHGFLRSYGLAIGVPAGALATVAAFGPVKQIVARALRALVALIPDRFYTLVEVAWGVVRALVFLLHTALFEAARALYHGLAWCGAALRDTVLAPIWSILGAIFGPLWFAVTWVAEHFNDALTFVFGEFAILKIVVMVFTIGFLAIFRQTVREIMKEVNNQGWLFGFWTLGQINRVRHGGFVAGRVAKRRAGEDEFDLLLRAARDLNRIYVEGIRASFSVAVDFDPKSLSLLADGYQAPEDFWSMLKDYLTLLGERIERGGVDADQTRTLLTELMPGGVSEFFDGARARLRERPTFSELILRSFQRADLRPVLAKFYARARARFPAHVIPFHDVAGLEVLWSDLDETSVALPALGVMRLAFEIEALGEHFHPRALLPIYSLVGQRLKMKKLLNVIHRTILPDLLRHGFDGTWPAADVSQARRLINAAKDLGYVSPNGTHHSADGWPLLQRRYGVARARALAAGDLERAVALGTWEALTPFTYPAITQLPWTLPRLLAAPFTSAAGAVTDALLNAKLGRFADVRELADYVETQLLRRGAEEGVLIPVLYKFIVAHPHLIRERADVDALVAHDFFWPEAPIENRGFIPRMIRTFNAIRTNFEAVDGPLSKSLEKQKALYPRAWRYETRLSQRLHRVILDRLNELGLTPRRYDDVKALWLALSERGVTSETDRLMQDLIQMATPEELPRLQTLAITEGRVWETELHSRLSIARALARNRYRRLLATLPGDPAREALLEDVIEDLKSSLPERGLAFAKFLEELSVKINSTYDEAKRISAAKGDVSSDQASDSNFETVRRVFRSVTDWPRADQFNFVKFLRGEARPSPRLLAAFPAVGVERVQRMYEILPLPARVGLFDTFFTHGLVRDDGRAPEWTRTLSRYIVGGQKTEAQRVTLQVLTSFLFAIGEVGNQQMTTTILSYLYALPSSAVASPVEVLKLVLELFGATGIKVGQFTYASQILGESGQALRSLQSRARVPDRIEMYEDVYDLLGVPVGHPLPFAVLELLGAASMKYAFMGEDRANLQKVVVKIFRLDAMNNVDLQFDVLEHMSEYLIKTYGAKYGVFKIIITSARRAVKREGSMPNEIRRSRIARAHVYRDRSTDEVEVEVPREDLVNARMIIAQYADGVPFDDLPEAAKPMFAKLVLEIEESIYFADAPTLRFDPDRHAGNAQMLFRINDAGRLVMSRHRLGPIDFGQLTRMPSFKRERITKLFALAQIAGRITANDWVTGEIASLLGLDDPQRARLRRHLRTYLKSAQPAPVPRYVATLAALDHVGFAITDTTYIDFVRGIIQLTPFERYAPGARAPSRTFERNVVAQIQEYLRTFQFEPFERRAVRAINAYRRVNGAVTRRPYQLIPLDLSQLTFDQIIQREALVACEEALDVAS